MNKPETLPTQIKAGRTNLYRYIGFQPPLSTEARTLLTDAGLVRPAQLEESGEKIPSTVAFYFTESHSGGATADEFVLERASQMTELLRATGLPVELDTTIADMRGGCSSPFTPATKIRF